MSPDNPNTPTPEQCAEALLREGYTLQDGIKFVDATLLQLSRVEEAWRAPTGHREVDASGQTAAARVSEEAEKLRKLHVVLREKLKTSPRDADV